MYKTAIKPLMDTVLGLLIFLLLLPFILLISFILVVINKGNPFFLQKRPGKNTQIFTVIKFKTMTDKRDKDGNLLPDHKRLTPFGKFLRSTSLDELPQLINVVKGDMSLVGPRPLLVKYLDRYSPRQARRHEVKPGITGWAQINGRNSLPWEERLELDVQYVERVSFRFDMMILFRTIQKVIQRKGISAPGQATMTEFKGEDYNKLNS